MGGRGGGGLGVQLLTSQGKRKPRHCHRRRILSSSAIPPAGSGKSYFVTCRMQSEERSRLSGRNRLKRAMVVMAAAIAMSCIGGRVLRRSS